MNKSSLVFSIALVALILQSCAPYEKEGIELPAPPSASFSFSYLPGDANRVVFQSGASDGFLHFWDFGNGLTSNEKNDTVYYPQEGMYDVSYSVSNSGGMGTAEASVQIDETVELPCEGVLELLTGCDNQKTWIWAQEAGAVSVGPDPYATSWFTSPASGLVPEQYDDSYQFTSDGSYIYSNSLLTVNPFQGYEAQAFDVPELNYLLSPGTGTSGEDQIVLPNCWFMGVRDSGPIYDIVELTESRLVIHGAIQDVDCALADGYFTLTFIAQ